MVCLASKLNFICCRSSRFLFFISSLNACSSVLVSSAFLRSSSLTVYIISFNSFRWSWWVCSIYSRSVVYYSSRILTSLLNSYIRPWILEFWTWIKKVKLRRECRCEWGGFWWRFDIDYWPRLSFCRAFEWMPLWSRVIFDYFVNRCRFSCEVLRSWRYA